MTRKPRTDLTQFGAAALAGLVADGRESAEQVTRAFLDRIAAEDGSIEAWAHVDPEYALQQARALDRHRQTGRTLGPLHGVPVGIKDIIDVHGLPCENGTPLDAGRMAPRDAAIVASLRQAGAVILGKTVTTELAVMHPGKTRNPHDAARTPGGSSSGSAAAVAARMAPLAIGTQTNGSVIRPASYCGVFGFKPSRGLVSRRGILAQSPALDSVGTFANSIEDIALVTEAITGYDDADKAMRPSSRPALARVAATRTPLRPALAFVRSPVWDQADDDMRQGFAELVETLGHGVDTIVLPEPFHKAHEIHRVIMLADIARNFSRYYEQGRDRLSDTLTGMIEEGRRVLAVDYALALDWIEVLGAALDEIFGRYDAIVTPAATGEAPAIATPGSPAFCTLWTYCGVPTVTVPLLTGANGLPVGVQIVGARGNDARLLRTANWIVRELSAARNAEHNVA